MLNFREELDKVRHKRKCISTNSVESLLKQLIAYYECQDVSEIFDTREINFRIDEMNNIIGTIYDMDEEFPSNFSIFLKFNSREEAQKILLDLEYKFKSEGFRIMWGKSAKKDSQFAVLIVWFQNATLLGCVFYIYSNISCELSKLVILV